MDMNIDKAIQILGANRATWELNNMKRALSCCSILNTSEENERLDAVKFALSHKKEFFAACSKCR